MRLWKSTLGYRHWDQHGAQSEVIRLGRAARPFLRWVLGTERKREEKMNGRNAGCRYLRLRTAGTEGGGPAVDPGAGVSTFSPRRGRLWDLRRCTMTPMMSAAPTSTTASTEKLAMAASFHTSDVSSTDLPADWTQVRSALPSPAHISRGPVGNAYRCCRRGSWDTFCTTHRADTGPRRSSRTLRCCTDLRRKKNEG